MSARPETPAPFQPQLSPKAAELGGLSAMRQTMSEFSLDSLSSLLDDELSLEADAPPAPQAAAPAPVPAATMPVAIPPAEMSHATMPVARTSGVSAPTELVSPAHARLSALTQPQANVRKSSLEETQLYKSTPQPTIDLSIVRRSASEPTQAFTGHLSDYLDASATIPAVVDPKKSSVPETGFGSSADSDAVDHSGVTQHMPLSLADMTGAFHVPTSPVASPAETFVTHPIEELAPEASVAANLAAFFEGAPRRTTDSRWEEAVESDRQFTTMLLSDMDELPWQAELRKPAPEIVQTPFAAVESPSPIIDAASAAQPLMAVSAESPSLDPGAFDVLEVAGAEQASVAAALAPQPHFAPQEAPAVANVPAPFPEPTHELRELAAFLLDRFTPGVSTVVALVGCEATGPGSVASLAIAAAVADATGVSTLVVDGDFANREISAACNFAAAPGFAEALGKPAKGRDLAHPVGRENLSLLPAGDAFPEAADARACVSAWIAKAKQEFGLILVWVGAGEGEIARRLCRAADASLLLAVVDRDRPSRIEAAAERLRSSNARTIGVALVR